MKNDILVKFGDRIRILRKAKNWSQDELAEASGFHKNYIGMIERGERNPSLINVNVLANTFGISLAELLKIDV